MRPRSSAGMPIKKNNAAWPSGFDASFISAISPTLLRAPPGSASTRPKGVLFTAMFKGGCHYNFYK